MTASRSILAVSMLAIVLASGCGYPAAQPMNQEIISSLRTACSAGDQTWLAANLEKVEQRRSEGQMNDAEYEAFKSIIAKAESGDWKGAEQACLSFQEAQQPTAEQIAKVRAFHSK